MSHRKFTRATSFAHKGEVYGPELDDAECEQIIKKHNLHIGSKCQGTLEIFKQKYTNYQVPSLYNYDLPTVKSSQVVQDFVMMFHQ